MTVHPAILAKKLCSSWKKLPQKLLSFIWLALSACSAVLIGELLINALYFGDWQWHFSGTLAVLGNFLILFCSFLIILVVVNRTFVAAILGSVLYGVVILADILKLSSFDNPVRVSDLQYLPDLKVIAKSSLGYRSVSVTLIVLVAIIVAICLLWKKERHVLIPAARILTGFAAMAILVSLFVVPSYPAPREWLHDHGIEKPEWWEWEPRGSAQLNGLLVELAMNAGEMSFNRPDRYGYSEVSRIGLRYQKGLDAAPVVAKTEPPPNLIIFLVESFMDPQDLGVPFTSDPIPTFRALSKKYSSGKVVVPVFGGTSANTEFEVLTAMTMSLMPEDSCPYRQYINADLPSLPRFLHQNGYRTEAVLADPAYLFSRKKVLGHLGFDHWDFPEGNPSTPRTPDDEFATDDVIADAAMQASRKGSPFFFLGFTGGTHCPWEYDDYDNSSLDIVGPMAQPGRKRLKTYINALRVADNALKKMIEYYEKVDQRTMILIMGDHLPPLGDVYDSAHFFKSGDMEEVRQRYSVPAVLWSNFPTAKKDFICSANLIPAKLIELMELQPRGIFSLSADVYSHFPVFSRYVQTWDGHLFDPAAPDLPLRNLVEEYRLMQYDLLIGSQYALELPGWGLTSRNAKIH